MSRQGSRGGTTPSREEGAVVQELHRPDVVGTVDAAIWDVLDRQGQVHADDLVDVPIPADAVNVIGNRINVFARKGYTAAIGWRAATNPASHGRQSRIWQITDRGRAELARRAGVGGAEHGNQTQSSKERAIHPGTDVPDLSPLPRPGGGDTNSQDVAAPDDLQLPLGDVPQAQTRRASYEDWDMEAA